MPLPIIVINSNSGCISHRFRDMATYSLKLFTKNCGKTTADEDMVTIDSLWRWYRPIRWYHCRPPTTYRL